MRQQYKGFLLGLLTAICLAVFLGARYGSWRQRLGTLQGHKDGEIEVIEFLAKHFPVPSGEDVLPGNEFGLKWYRAVVVEMNGVKTLRVKNEM